MKTAIIFTNKELKIICYLLKRKVEGAWLLKDEYDKYKSLLNYIEKYLMEGNK